MNKKKKVEQNKKNHEWPEECPEISEVHHRFNVVFHPRSFSMFVHKVHGAIVKGCRVAERNNPL